MAVSVLGERGMTGCNLSSFQLSNTHTRPTFQRTTVSTSVHRRPTHISCAANNPRKRCDDVAALSLPFAQRRVPEIALAAVIFLACGSAAEASSTFATTLSVEEMTPNSRNKLDMVPMLRFKHPCMPRLPVSDSLHAQSDWTTVSDEVQQIQATRKLQERYRVSPPACNSPDGGGFVVRPNGSRVSQPVPRFALLEAPPLATPRPAALTIATLPSVVLSMSEAIPSDVIVPGKYVPGPVEVGWQIYVGSAVAAFPFVLGSYEFGKRILIQRRCETCSGIGLVKNSKGTALLKCSECGGFFPWLGWKTFFTSTASPGNGGPLMQPKGQTSVFYTVPPIPSKVASTEQQPTVTPEARTEASGDEATAVVVKKEE